MKMFHVILSDELGEEFSIEIPAYNWQTAYEKAHAEYIESQVVYVKELKPYNRADWSCFIVRNTTY